VPRVSVVLPARDAATTVGAAVSSVLWQTYADLELLVVDDGSTDATAAIVSAFADERVRLLSTGGVGVAAARNRAVEAAAGELVTFCDADDLLFEQHLAALVERWDEAGGIVTANAWWLFPGGIAPGHTRHKGRFPRLADQRMAILEQNFVSMMSITATTLFHDVGPFDERLERASDWDLWMRAVLSGVPVAHQPRPLALYRWGATGLSTATDRMDAAVRAILQKAALRTDLLPEERAYVVRRLAGPGPRELGREGDGALADGRWTDAARLLGMAADLSPSERRLVWKARVLRAAPRLAGPLLRARDRRRSSLLGADERHVR
jgi:GT2 family glycosyltransferase